MHTNARTSPGQVVAGKLMVGKFTAALCLLMLLLLLPTVAYAADAPSKVSAQLGTPIPGMLPTLADITGSQEQENSALTVPTVPTVPTATPSPTITTTVTPTPTVTTTPTPSPTAITVDPSGEKIVYEVVFTNDTGETINDAKIDVEVPPYTIFNLQESTQNWVCPTGITSGNTCTYVWGDIPPDSVGAAALVNAVWTSTMVLDVLTNQLPPNAEVIAFDVVVLDGAGKIYATYSLSATLPEHVVVYRVLLPIVRQ